MGINTISSLLISIISISLIVAALMVGIITGISTLQRRKEIGLLRALGGRKRDIRRIFNVETFLTGLISGLVSIIVIWLIGAFANNIVHIKLATTENIAIFPFWQALTLVVISILLSVIAGFIPAFHASRKDPVKAMNGD